MGVNFPGLFEPTGAPNVANTMADYLSRSNSGYHPVSAEQAQSLADTGVVVFGTQIRAGHGHIVTVRPKGIPGDNPVVPVGKDGKAVADNTIPILANVGYFNGVAHAHVAMDPRHGKIFYYAPNR